MFLYFLSIIAICTCLLIVCFLKITATKQQFINKQDRDLTISAVDFLKVIKKSKPFPVGVHKCWILSSCHHGNRLWIRKLSYGNHDIITVATSLRLNASSQVAFSTLKDMSKICEWKVGVDSATYKTTEKSTPRRSSSWLDASVGMDHIVENVLDSLLIQKNDLQMYERYITRYWYREENGCCWMSESDLERQEHIFYLIQPLEDLDTCLMTVFSYVSNQGTLWETEEKISSYLQSLSNYFTHRKVKATPFIDLRLPSKHSHHSHRELESQNLSSSDEEDESDIFQQKFQQLHPEEKSAILQRSESILRLSGQKVANRPRTLSDNANFKNDLSGSDRSRPRSQTQPNTQNSPEDAHSKDNNNTNKISQIVFKEENGATEEMDKGSVKYSDAMEGHHEQVRDTEGKEMQSEETENHVADVENKVDTNQAVLREIVDMSVTDTDLSEISSQENDDIANFDDIENAKEIAKNTTLANQVAAELLALVHRVSNLDLKASPRQQQDSTGGWMFCGLESDVVIIKRQYHNINLSGSYIGKGIIQASPQAVMDAIKNPRTRYTYDESLKRVDILQQVTDKIKIVYYSNEVLHKFKKFQYDSCVIQSERNDGEKLVLSMESVDTGLPIPVGVNRIKVLPSGWIIEPVTRDNKIVSMVTYVMQMNYGLCSEGAADKSLIEEMVSKQPLSIAYLRQYLRPAFATERKNSPMTTSPFKNKTM